MYEEQDDAPSAPRMGIVYGSGYTSQGLRRSGEIE
jgi:hypothetical protein